MPAFAEHDGAISRRHDHAGVGANKARHAAYLAATPNFASGKQTPRQFLERSLELLEYWEPRIGAFVCTNLPAARAAADRSTERWRAGQAAARRSTACRSASRTSSRPSTCRPRWARRCLPAGARRRTPPGARAARRRRGHPRQDGDDRIRRVRAARHAQSVEHRAYAGRLVERLGGRGRRRHRQRGARHPGDRLDHPAGELLRLRRLQAERQCAQPRRQPRLSEPELHRRARRVARGRLAGRPRDRRPRRRRCRHARPARAGHAAAGAKAAPSRRARNRRLGQRLGRRQAAARRMRHAAEIRRRRNPHAAERRQGRGAGNRSAQRRRNCRIAATAGRRAGSSAPCAIATPPN